MLLGSTASQSLQLKMLNFGNGPTKFGGVKRKNAAEVNINVAQGAMNLNPRREATGQMFQKVVFAPKQT